MRLPKEDAMYLRNLLEENPNMAKEDFKEVFARFFTPDIPKLIDQAVNRRVNNFVAGIRGGDGIRKCFIVDGGTGPEIVNIENTQDINDARKVAERLEASVQRRIPGMVKAKRKLRELEGQISVYELVQENQEETRPQRLTATGRD